MRILELCLSPDLGGLELYMLRCVQQLRQTDDVIAVVANNSKPAQYLERAAIHYQTLKVRVRALPLVAARRLASIIDEQHIDLVHMHWGKDLAVAALAKAMSNRKPALLYTRQMQITRPKRDMYHRFLYGQVSGLLGITQILADDMRRFIPQIAERIDYLYYGVAAPQQSLTADERLAKRRSSGIPDGVFLVGLFGRIKHYKGQHLLVDALSRARAEGLPLHGLIVGRAMEDDYLANLKSHCQQDNLPVTFMDFVDQPQALMQACDCVILTTIEETFGLVLVEAMRAGIAVIGSDRGGVPEIIDHGETGLLFRSGEAQDLYGQLRRLATEAGLKERLASAGKAKADRMFAEEAHFSALRQRIAALVSSGSVH